MDGGRLGLPPVEDDLLPQDIAFLKRYGAHPETLRWVRDRASIFGETPASCMISNGLITEADYFRCVAAELGLEFTTSTTAHGQPFISPPDPADIRRMSRMVQVERFNEFNLASQFSAKALHLAPDCSRMDALKSWVSLNHELRPRLKIAPFSVNREALETRCSLSLLARATDSLRNRFPTLSARRVFTPKQAVVLVLALQLLIVMVLFSTPAAFLFLHLTASLFYLGCIALRLIAAVKFVRPEREPLPWGSVDRQEDHRLPTYSVLVPLYREDGQVNELVGSLLQLDWPKERLEVKLICEADDVATIRACQSAIAGAGLSHFSIVTVPDGEPKTKPKALAYALPLCLGSLVVIYDAEDRPDALQLREAFQEFQRGPSNLACVQAPLVIYNSTESWLSRLFAIEYSALFDGLVPMLSDAGAPVPLGGTSNHFKRSVLDNLGGWDPYNVTEDADLGVRMARAGYRTGTLRLPTYEEAPITLNVWTKQRTRWFKGWYQTWLVHMRNPVATAKDLGFRNSIVFQLIMAGMAISALVHPVLLYFIFMDVAGFVGSGTWRSLAGPLVGLDITTVFLGYFSFGWLAWRTLPVRGLSHLRWWLFSIPVYWLLLSVAAWRGLFQLLRNPHFCGLR